MVAINGHVLRDSDEISESEKSSQVTTPVERIEMEMTKKTTTPVDANEAMKIGVITNYGKDADISFTAGQRAARNVVRDYVANIGTTASVIPIKPPRSITTSTSITAVAATTIHNTSNHHPQPPQPQQSVAYVAGLSPRLEMRLALNQDIMGDEDLINYAPGPDLSTLLGCDLSTYHRMTGKDLLNRSAVAASSKVILSRQGQIISSQQKNSKMDTPTLNRKKSSLSTWSSSASVDQGIIK